jgi:hypothetical protein
MDQASVTTWGRFIRIVAENGDKVISLLPGQIKGLRTSIDEEGYGINVDTSGGFCLGFYTLNRALVIDVILATIALLEKENN